MPNYQLSSVDSDKLVLGNNKMEVATSAGSSTYTDLGAGMVTEWRHPVEKWNTQAGNAPDPIEGIADETCIVVFEMLEFDASVMNVIYGGLISVSTTSSVITIHAGGNLDNEITERAYRFTNSRTINSNTVETILTVYFATCDQGPSYAWKSDNDEDPMMVMAVGITGKLDTTRDNNQQLYTLTHDLPG